MSGAPVDPTRGPLLPALLRLALPVVVMQVCHTLYHWVDVMWVGRLGADATAGVSMSFFATWTLWALADLVAVAVGATVSRHVGAGERPQAAYAAAQAAILAVALGTVVSIAGALGAPALFRLLGAPPEVARHGVAYFTIAAGGAVVSFLYVLFESILRAAGDTRTPMKIVAASLALNAVLDPILIFGLGPIPALGVAGAAIASVIAQVFAVARFVLLARRGHAALPFDFGALTRPAPAYALALVRIGAPYALIGVLYSIVYLALARTTAPFGAAGLAVLGVANRIESLTYLVAAGFGLACEALVGQNLGARRPDRAERGTWSAAWIMAAFGIVTSIPMWFVPEMLIGFFTSDPEVIARGVPYLKILAPCQAFAAFEMVLTGAFAGAGNTVPPSTIGLVTSLARIPLAPWVAFGLGLGLDGIAWTISVTCVVRALVLLAWFRRGRWKTRRPATAAHALAAPDAAP